MIPATGILLIPLGLVIAFLPWRYCLAGLMLFATMPASAVVNYGSFGLQPGYYLALLLIARTAFEIATQKFTLNAFVGSRLRPLWWFAVTAFAVLFFALCFFQNVETLPGTYGFKSGLAHPFRLARENFTQIAYLGTNICLLYVIAHNGARQSATKLAAFWDTAIVCGLCFAVAICVWQFTSFYVGLPFPGDFFYSNAGYGRADSQSLVGLLRINGPFEEPSTLGYAFTGFLLFSWGRYRNHPTAGTIAMIAACIFCMMVSTSTTAFLGLFLFFCLVVFNVTTGRVVLLRRNRTLSARHLAILGLIFTGVTVGMIAIAANWQAINVILQMVLFNKADSTSYQQRSFADSLAVQIFTQTYGIGIGLGSHKANSLLLTLLSNTGVIGLVLFVAFAFSLLRWKGASAAIAQATRPLQLYLLGILLIHAFSNPNLSVLILWLSMGSVLSVQAAEHAKRAAATAVIDLRPNHPKYLAGSAV